MVETDFEETLKIFEIFRRRMNHFASNSVINFVPNQTCECVQLQWRCCMTMQDFFHMAMPFTRHCGTRIFPMSWGGSHWHHDFDDGEAWKVWRNHGKLWGCMGKFIRLGKSLAEPGKKDHGAAQGAILVLW